MIEIRKATTDDVKQLTEIQARTFLDDNKLKPPGCSLEGPPGYNSADWNARWMGRTPYFKILLDGQIVGGIIVFDLGQGHYELGRIYVDPDLQNQGIGQQAVRQMFAAFPEAVQWTLGTPSWGSRPNMRMSSSDQVSSLVMRSQSQLPTCAMRWASVKLRRRDSFSVSAAF